MENNKLNYLIYAGLLVSFFTVFITGIIKYPGLIRAIGLDYTSMRMGSISMIHELAGITMGILVLIHLISHRRWFFSAAKELFIGRYKK